jgi:hypothetical protein
VVKMLVVVFWFVMCSHIGGHQCFTGIYLLHLKIKVNQNGDMSCLCKRRTASGNEEKRKKGRRNKEER